jgi:hypothetical protein
MNSLGILKGRRVRAVVLDVRGTLIHPVLDEPVSSQLIALLHQLLRANVIVAVNTATSIQSLQGLLLAPLHSGVTDVSVLAKLVLYVDSSTAAYRINATGDSVPLSGFKPLHFSDAELGGICEAMAQAVTEFNLRGVTRKIKAGQVNFYCGGTWSQRSSIAQSLDRRFVDGRLDRVVAMVPTAKETIDIAICKKDRGIQDLLERFSLAAADLIIIGDSMQESAPDLDMARSAPDCIAIQVGQVTPADGILHLLEMEAPIAVGHILEEVLRSFNE